ncbi:MAG: NFACT RNA binding domain-containing protein [Nanoarchaeota archaeon]
MINYKKYKWFFTKSGKLVVGGKSAESNDTLLTDLKKMRKELIVMHTKSPGSPFCAIIAPVSTTSASDIEECAVFTGCFSRAWKEGKKSASVHMFKLSQLSKSSNMKSGSWNVNGKVKDFNVNLELVITKQNDIVRAVPKLSVNADELIAFAYPGKIDKTKLIISNKSALKKLNKEQLLSALPAGGVTLK